MMMTQQMKKRLKRQEMQILRRIKMKEQHNMQTVIIIRIEMEIGNNLAKIKILLIRMQDIVRLTTKIVQNHNIIKQRSIKIEEVSRTKSTKIIYDKIKGIHSFGTKIRQITMKRMTKSKTVKIMHHTRTKVIIRRMTRKLNR